MLNEDSFNLDGEVSLATISGEAEHMEAEIVADEQDLDAMSLTVQKKNKELLANMRNQAMLRLDKRKLQEAEKILTGLENIGSMFSDDEIMEKVRESVSTAQDMKFLAEAYTKLLDAQRNLMRMDSVDGAGNAKKISIGVRYEDDGGTKLETLVKVGD